MSKRTYILEHDYFSSDARLYKAGEKIELDENDDAVRLCAKLKKATVDKPSPKEESQNVEDGDKDEKAVKPASKKSKSSSKKSKSNIDIF